MCLHDLSLHHIDHIYKRIVERSYPAKSHLLPPGPNQAQDSPQAIFTSFKLEKNDSNKATPNQDYHHRDGPLALESESRFKKDLLNRSDEDDTARRLRSLSPSKMFLPMEPPPSSSMPLFATPDFGGFSQILEKHMREIKAEPSATVTHEMDLSYKEKVRRRLCMIVQTTFTKSA